MPNVSLPTSAPNVLVAPLDDEAVLLDLDSRRYFQVNVTGREIWDALAAGEDRQVIVGRLVDSFEVTPGEAAAAVDAFVHTLRANALLMGG